MSAALAQSVALRVASQILDSMAVRIFEWQRRGRAGILVPNRSTNGKQLKNSDGFRRGQCRFKLRRRFQILLDLRAAKCERAAQCDKDDKQRWGPGQGRECRLLQRRGMCNRCPVLKLELVDSRKRWCLGGNWSQLVV